MLRSRSMRRRAQLTVAESRDPCTTFTARIWQSAAMKKAVSAKEAALSGCFHFGAPRTSGPQGGKCLTLVLLGLIKQSFEWRETVTRPRSHKSLEEKMR